MEKVKIWAYSTRIKLNRITKVTMSLLLTLLVLGVAAGTASAAQAPALGTAGNFAVMGATGVTNAGASLITGNLGAGPTAPSITGFNLAANTIVYGTGGTVTDGLGMVTGTIYAGGPVANQAHNDAVIAYNYLVAQVPDTNYSGDDYPLDGLILTPGVYRFAPSANLRVNGTLYLDFQGNSDALFIFQMGSTLVTMANSKVIAINTTNSQNCTGSNVYWAVGSSATIDGSQFVGTVIAYTTITMTSAANSPGVTNVSGRMLALNGAVTMVNDTIATCGSSGGSGTVPPKPCRDFVTGGGWIEGNSVAKGHGHKSDESTKATFGVSGGIMNGKFWGQLSFNDHNGTKVKSTNVTAYTYIDAVTRQIEGFARVNGNGSFKYTVVVADKAEPGHNKDTFSLNLSNGYSASGTLQGGNIQLHKECGKPHDNEDKENHNDKDEVDGHNSCDK